MPNVMKYAVGHNLPGYLPNEAPELYDDWALAKSALLSDCNILIDDDVEYSIAVDNIEFAITGDEVCVYADGEYWWINVVYVDEEIVNQLELW